MSGGSGYRQPAMGGGSKRPPFPPQAYMWRYRNGSAPPPRTIPSLPLPPHTPVQLQLQHENDTKIQQLLHEYMQTLRPIPPVTPAFTNTTTTDHAPMTIPRTLVRQAPPVPENHCGVCRRPFLAGEVVGNLWCQHKFHRTCMMADSQVMEGDAWRCPRCNGDMYIESFSVGKVPGVVVAMAVEPPLAVAVKPPMAVLAGGELPTPAQQLTYDPELQTPFSLDEGDEEDDKQSSSSSSSSSLSAFDWDVSTYSANNYSTLSNTAFQ